MTSQQRLAFLIYRATDTRRRWTSPLWREIKRFLWNQIKYNRPLGKCWVCGARARVGHHVTPLSRGGWFGWYNVVSLCNHCHAKVHPWLAGKRKY